MKTSMPQLLTIALLCPLASAQVGSATLTLQASLDQGASWQGGTIQVAQNTGPILVRSWLQWTPDAGTSLASAGFDIAINNAGAQDAVSDMRRPSPLDQEAQTIAATRFGSTIKIDDARDTLPPGVGLRGVRARQSAPNSGNPHTFDNPLAVFFFAYQPDSTLGQRAVTALISDPPDDRAILCYITPNGLANRVRTTVIPLTINIIPTPATAAVLLCLPALTLRRRR